jgi:hypothetical protein
MKYNEENIRLILGLKIRQKRIDRNLSLKVLAEKSGISISYLNEIEKGKKNPKPAKLALIAEALDVSYDWLVSLQLGKELGPFADILQSELLQELPLDTFGINKAGLMELFAQEPAKAAALVAALRNTAQVAGFDLNLFHKQSLRAFREMNGNYFTDIEKEVAEFRNEHFPQKKSPDAALLRQLLEAHYRYTILEADFGDAAYYAILDKKAGAAILYINRLLSEERKKHVFARELAFLRLQLKSRPVSFPNLSEKGFDHSLSNMMADYFASVLFLGNDDFESAIRSVFTSNQWQPWKLEEILSQYRVGPELLAIRLLSILNRNLGFTGIFFSRVEMNGNSGQYEIEEEVHIPTTYAMHASNASGHYCRRWIALSMLTDLKSESERRNISNEIRIDARISEFLEQEEFLTISVVQSAYPIRNKLTGFNISILIDGGQKQEIGFLNDPKIKITPIGHLCETCPISNCRERVSERTTLESKDSDEHTSLILERLRENYSK